MTARVDQPRPARLESPRLSHQPCEHSSEYGQRRFLKLAGEQEET